MASGSSGGGSVAQPLALQLAAAWVLMASGGRGIAARPTQWLGVAPFENGQYARLLNRGRGGYLFADESGERVRTDRHRRLINTVWCVQILDGDSPHSLLRGAYGRYVAGMPMGAGEGHIGNLITQRVLETMDTDVMWRTIPGPRGGGVVLINASSFNGVLRALRANGKYQRWNRGVSLQYFDRFNARFSSMMEWEVQVIPTSVQRPPFQVVGAASLCGLRCRGSGEIQVGISVADHDGNFNVPGRVILSVPGRSLIELGSALEERLGSNFRFRDMSIFIGAGNFGQPFLLLTDLPSGLDVVDVVLFMVGTSDLHKRLVEPRHQEGIGMADNGNFNGPCELNLSNIGRSLIQLDNALEDRFGYGLSFKNMSLFIRAGNLGQPFPLLTDLPREIDNIDVIMFMVGPLGEKLTTELPHSVVCTPLFFCQK